MKSHRKPELHKAVRRTEDAQPESGEAGPAAPEPVSVGARPAAQSGLSAAGPGMASELRRLASAEDVLGGTAIPADVRSTLQLRRGGGSPLPAGVSSGVGRRLGQDLSGVRVHADGEADRLARSMQSVAFTQGSDIYFSRGAYSPETASGSRLLAHELGHVAERSAGTAATIGRADDPVEAAADRAATRIAPDVQRLASGHAPAERAKSAALDDGESGPVRRKISKTSRDIDELRSEAGQEKGKRTSDSLHRIGLLLERLGRWGRPDKDVLTNLDAVIVLCDRWLKKHRRTNNAHLLALVEQIRREADRDRRIMLEQLRYLNDARAGTRAAGKWGNAAKSETALTHQIGQNAHTAFSANEAAAKLTEPLSLNPKDAEAPAARLMRDVGLTEAEVIAIKLFTGPDYKYINPATANSAPWLDRQIPDIQAVMKKAKTKLTADPAKLMQQGKRHSEVMMHAMAKLPPMSGKVFRGERMTEEAFKERFEGKSKLRYDSFVSSSIKPGIPQEYADGREAGAGQTVSVFSEFSVSDARDIQSISEAKSEEEWLLLPGATFTITGKKTPEARPPGKDPKATSWWVIELKQTNEPLIAVPKKPNMI